jgi:SWI/SNF-related matrix-associated actin-dependent regulator 1 of chromatin subfamily A
LHETIMVRRMKRDVLTELPEKLRQVVVLPEDKIRGAVGREKRAYHSIQKQLSLARIRAEIAKTAEDDAIYRQAVNDLREAEFITIQQITKLRTQTAMVKIPLVIEHVMNVLEHVQKVVIFAHHTAVIENLALDFGKAVVTVHGKHDTTERQRRIDKFQTDASVRVLIASMKATGVGLNMTAAQVACFAELDWAPSVVAQAEDRLHRIGQAGSVLVQHLVLDGSIDAMVAQKIVEKQDTISVALDDDGDRIDALYAISRATPFVEGDRETILNIAAGLSYDDVFAVHDTLKALASRGRRGVMSSLDFSVLNILAQQESLEPNQAALGLVLVNKYAQK